MNPELASIVEQIVKARYTSENHFVVLVTNLIAPLAQDKEIVDELERRVWCNREGENELHFDFTMPTLREATKAKIKAKLCQTK